eukprot:150799-Prorocentrum_minimum.AAC.1
MTHPSSPADSHTGVGHLTDAFLVRGKAKPKLVCMTVTSQNKRTNPICANAQKTEWVERGRALPESRSEVA